MLKKFEKSWDRLEIRLPNTKPPMSTTHKKSRSLDKLSDFFPQPTSTPKHVRNRSLNTMPLLEGISLSQIQFLFRARCQDLEIARHPGQEDRFVQLSKTYFKNRRVSLKNMNLGTASCKALSKILKSDRFFSILDLSFNNIGNTGIIALARGLRYNSSLVHIDLSCNSITSDGAIGMFKELEGHPSIASLNLQSMEGHHRNHLGSPGAVALSNLLVNNPVLTHINIAGNAIRSVEPLVKGLMSKKNLVSLNIANNNLTSVQTLCEVLQDVAIEEFVLSDNPLGNKEATFIGYLIARHHHLYILDASSIHINTEGLTEIMKSFHGNMSLQVLKLNKNDFSNGLGYELPHAFTKNSYIKELQLCECELTDKGIIPLYETLVNSTGLLTLNLSKNKIADSGAAAIAKGLYKNEVLLSLVLDQNRIHFEGVKSLSHSLMTNFALQKLSLRENYLHNDSLEELLELARNNPSIIQIKVKGNHLSNMRTKDLKNVLKSNREEIKKERIPKLKERIDYLAFDKHILKVTEYRIKRAELKCKHENRRLKSTEKILVKIKHNENNKFSIIHDTNTVLREKFEDVSRELLEIQEKMQIAEIKFQKELKKIELMTNALSRSITKAEHLRKILQEKLNLKLQAKETSLHLFKKDLDYELNRLNRTCGDKEALLEKLQTLTQKKHRKQYSLHYSREQTARRERHPGRIISRSVHR